MNDRWFRNRFDAMEWLGEHRSEAGRRAIEKRLDATLMEARKAENSTLDSEMALCGLTLGKIGDRASLPRARTVCQFLTDDDRWVGGGAGPRPSTIFAAFHGLALLGKKDEALRELRSVYDRHKDQMGADRQKEFQELLDKARQW